MKCCKCPFYESNPTWNKCKITGDEYFRSQEECDFVNDDGTQNEEAIRKAFSWEDNTNDR